MLLPRIPESLSERIDLSIDLFPCDLLFVHRDAEKQPMDDRLNEIQSALAILKPQPTIPVVCVVPVRMQEAWLLFDESAMRKAAGNKNGKVALELPELRTIEHLPDPKVTLHELLRQASGLPSRRRKKFRVHASAKLVAEYATNFSPLRQLPAFQMLEDAMKAILQEQQWV